MGVQSAIKVLQVLDRYSRRHGPLGASVNPIAVTGGPGLWSVACRQVRLFPNWALEVPSKPQRIFSAEADEPSTGLHLGSRHEVDLLD